MPSSDTQFTRENAREMQKKGAEARKRNRQIKELMCDVMCQKVGDITRAEWLIKQALVNTKDSVTLKDIKLIQEIMGESVMNVNVETKKPEDVVKEIMDAIQ